MQERMKTLDLNLSEISEYLKISRPTLYKYMDAYSAGNTDGIKGNILDFFKFIESKPNITKIDAMAFLINESMKYMKNEKLSSCFKDGYLDYDALLSLDDIELYEKYKDCPVSLYEKILTVLQNGTPREQLAISLEHNLKISGDIVRNAWKKGNFGDEYVKTIKEMTKLISKYGEQRLRGKRFSDIELKAIDAQKIRANCKVTFDKILNHKTLKFFEIACEEDSKKIDWALINVDPTRFDVLKILFDHGAKIHKIYTANNGWGDPVTVDEIDELTTAIKREEINRLLEVKK